MGGRNWGQERGGGSEEGEGQLLGSKVRKTNRGQGGEEAFWGSKVMKRNRGQFMKRKGVKKGRGSWGGQRPGREMGVKGHKEKQVKRRRGSWRVKGQEGGGVTRQP